MRWTIPRWTSPLKLPTRCGQPVVIFFAPVPFYPHANLRHYAFLAQGIPDTAERARKRGIGFVLRRYPEHSLLKFCDEVKGVAGGRG